MEFIQHSISDKLAVISLNRADKRNALNGAMIQDLLHLLQQLAKNQDLHALLIHGKGEHFCAGADIAWMKQIAESGEDENYKDAQHLADLLYTLYHFPKPTIVLAQGATMGGGLGLLAASDIAIAAHDASFGFSEVKIGLAQSTISPYVIAAIGERAAHYYFLTGERFDAKEAHRIGLIHRLTENAGLVSTGISIAKIILQNGPHALVAAKQLIRRVTKEKITEELSQKTAEHLMHLRQSKEAQEGLNAFLEKRAPAWS